MRLKPGYLLLTTLAALASCGGPSSSPTTGPTPVAPSPTPAPQPPPVALPGPGVALSGRILEVLPDGTRRPWTSARQVYVDVDGLRTVTVPVGADGNYRLTGVPDQRFVKIEGVWPVSWPVPQRFCGTSAITHGDTELDVPLFLSGAIVPTPTLSGQVFTVIDGKRVPVARADVYYQSRADGPDVSQYTDGEGLYSLCGIPPLPGRLYMICGNGVDAYRQAVDIRENAVIDIDATLFSTCLELVP